MSAPNATDVKIRCSTRDDFDGFYRCFADICRERRFLALVDPPPPDAARAFTDNAWRRGMVRYVAIAGSELVGWCDIIPDALEGFRHVGRLGMGIAAPFRGRGVGRQLVEATVAAARQAGLSRVELEVFSSNTHAIRLYERCGFAHEGRRRRGRIIDGHVEDVLVMGRLL